MCENIFLYSERVGIRLGDKVLSAAFLQQRELASRWGISPRTLEGWRLRKTGPTYIKIGAKVIYALADIEAYERRRRAEIELPILGTWRSA